MYELNGIKYDFKVISVSQGLKAKSLLLKMAKELEKDIIDDENESELHELILEVLRVYKSENGKDSCLEGLTMEQIGLIFSNPLAILEIQKSFSEVVMGFIQSLPSSQSSKSKKDLKVTHK